jgi:ATP phosphoribosyltransferase regulatory subunit HisZ
MGEEIEPQREVGFDLVAAQVRADAADTGTFFRVLASKLSDALGDRVKLERSGGLFKRDRAVTGIELDLTAAGAGTVLSARRESGGMVACTVARRVRGIVLSTKQVSMREWVEELVSALGDEARHSEQTWKALHGLLS